MTKFINRILLIFVANYRYCLKRPNSPIFNPSTFNYFFSFFEEVVI